MELTKPMFILVDKRTASASEVLSAALKENGRAKLVGERTFGKVGQGSTGCLILTSLSNSAPVSLPVVDQGVVQTIESVSQGAGVSVTIARYETPQGNNINKKGLEVDVPVQCEAAQEAVSCLPDSLSSN
jgi:carboxyl-terminal processing protease